MPFSILNTNSNNFGNLPFLRPTYENVIIKNLNGLNKSEKIIFDTSGRYLSHSKGFFCYCISSSEDQRVCHFWLQHPL